MTHTLKIQDANGHTEVKWNPETGEGVDTAKEKFDHFSALGYFSYKANPGAVKEQIRDFDPFAETIIQTVPLIGG